MEGLAQCKAGCDSRFKDACRLFESLTCRLLFIIPIVAFFQPEMDYYDQKWVIKKRYGDTKSAANELQFIRQTKEKYRQWVWQHAVTEGGDLSHDYLFKRPGDKVMSLEATVLLICLHV